jgi:formate hydrogenlyase subunit 3/multisubunit Na+/H+ antiporter MnhD subunit
LELPTGSWRISELDNILLTLVFLPLIVGFVILFVPNVFKGLSKLIVLIITILSFVLAIRLYRAGDMQSSWLFFDINGMRLELILGVNALNSFILLFAMGFGLLIALYSLRSSQSIKRVNEFYGSLLLAVGATAGALLSGHLLFLLIFWEIVTVSLYLLVSTGGRESNFAATKTLAMTGASDAAFLLGIGMVWMIAGTFEISAISIEATTALPIIAFLLLMLAATTKAGAVPLHTWLPTSGETAPVSVMALLPAAIDKLLGIYLLVLIVKGMFDLQAGALTLILAIIGSATIIIAVMIALVQHNIKKLLSYHAISQVGYMVLGIATVTTVGVAGGVFHMLNHAIYKCCLFLCGGAVEQQTGTAELDKLGGLGNKMPLTFLACITAALSISGIPPLNGFASKWMIYQGVVEMGNIEGGGAVANLWPLWLLCAMFGSALTLASFVKILHSMFLSRLPERLQEVKEVAMSQAVPMLVLAGLCVFFGIFYTVPLEYFIYPALEVVGMDSTSEVYIGNWNSIAATGLLLLGIGVGFILLMISSFGKSDRSVPTWNCGEIQPNDKMIIPGTHFYKTVSDMKTLKTLYGAQEKGYFDLYHVFGNIGLLLSDFLRWLHCGILPMYLTWVTVGLLIIILTLCGIW